MNKTKNSAGFQPRVAPAQPLTEEQKKMKIAQFLQQKREIFAINILVGLCHNAKGLRAEDLINTAVDMADKLIEKLYPLPEEEQQK